MKGESGMIMHGIKLAALAAILCGMTAAQTPFGFREGMSLEEITRALGKQNIQVVDTNVYSASTAPKPHPDFASYGLVISPTSGLVKIIALTETFSVNDFGSQMKDRFAKTLGSLTAIYGAPKLLDYLMVGSIWKADEDWMMGLMKEDRTLEAIWLSPKTDNGPNLSTIALKSVAGSRSSGWLRLAYEFKNFDQYIDGQKKKSDSVF